MRHPIPTLILCLAATSLGLAQDVTVNRSNKTVEVTVTAKVEADPDVAVLSLGSTAYGRTHDAAFSDNVRASDKIIRVLLDAHVPKAASNTVRKPKGWPFATTLERANASIGTRRQPELQMFPKKVEQEATVHAIFAID